MWDPPVATCSILPEQGRYDHVGVAVIHVPVLADVEAAARPGDPREVRAARNWAKGALAFARLVRFVEPALVDGNVGLIWAPRGRLWRALTFTLRTPTGTFLSNRMVSRRFLAYIKMAFMRLVIRFDKGKQRR
jgi:hypothetical protein